jgi:predicted DNA-binding transcriptional regulator YafY
MVANSTITGCIMDKKHDTLSLRLANILLKLNNGEKLNPLLLAQEYKVSLRTIQRDLHERLGVLPIQQDNGLYSLETFYLGKLSLKDIKNFATLAGVSGLFPKLDNDFIRSILDTTISQAYEVKGQTHEDVSQLQGLFKKLQDAIVQHYQLIFRYKNSDHQVQPYKLIHHHGSWYLAADHQDKLKAYKLAHIEKLTLGHDFNPDPKLVEQVAKEDSIWFGSQKREVILTVDKKAAAHFKRRLLVPTQNIIKELEDGSLIISSYISHDLQILPIVRYWIPHVRVLSPDSVREACISSVRQYLGV